MKNIHLKIIGRVQHKGFRFSAMQNAYKFGITGIIRNLKDGALYIEAEGDEENLDKFVEWCNRGPIGAKVEEVIIENGELKNYTGFDIL